MGNIGVTSLRKAVERDCNDERNGCGCFNPDGCNVQHAQIGQYGEDGYKRCTHKYCDKYAWVIQRAKHYANKTGLDWEEIMESWESNRDYWYMNYYQDCNQPEINGNKVRVFETVEEMLAAIGEKQFRCPACGGVSTNPYACNSGDQMKNGKTCDWKVYGLFKDLGKGVAVFCKDKLRGETIFMPLSWEDIHDNPELLGEVRG